MEKNQGQAQPLLLVCEDLKKALAWRDALELGGLATELETNGMVGLDRALSGRFRLILLDQRLASIDCVGVYRRIRNYTPLPVLALPGPAAASGPSSLLDALADPWLARQIDPEDFPDGPLSEADLLRLVRQRLARADSRD